MPGSDKTVKVALVLDASLYGKGAVQASSATNRLGRDMDAVSTKSKAMESGLGKVNAKLGGMGIAAGAVAGGALVSFLTSAVKAAGDLEQSVGGVDAVFKDAAGSIHAFGKNSADAVGLSTNEFNQLITVTGALLKNKGLEDFAGKSLDLVKVGADLAAQFGGPTSQAVEALNAAMRGESDPIERYGISLNQNAVNAELASKGLSKLKGRALDQATAQARLDIITRQSADALGTFAREADTLQGQQQRLSAEWANARAELGTALLPAVTDVTKALRSGVDVAVAAGHAWAEIPGPLKAAVAALVLYHLTSSKVVTGVGSARDAIRRMRDELALQQTLATGITGGYQRLGDEAQVAGSQISRSAAAMGVASKAARGVGSALLGAFGGPIGLAVTALGVAIGVFAQQHVEAKRRVEDFTEAIKADSGALGANTKEAVANALEKAGAAKAARDLGVNLTDLTNATLGQADAQRRVNEQIAASKAASVASAQGNINAADALSVWQKNADKVTGAIKGQNGEVLDAQEAAKRHAELMGDAASATDKAATAADGFGSATKESTDELKKQEDAAKKAAQAVRDLADAQLAASGAQISYQDALAGVDERLQKRKELEAELAKAGGSSDRTKSLQEKVDGGPSDRTRHLQRDLAATSDAKKQATLRRQLADSQEADAKRLSKAESDLAASRSKDAQKNSDEIARIRKELADYSAGVNLSTEAGRENQKVLNDLADAARRKSEADIKAGVSLKDLRSNMAAAREQFIDSAVKLGVSREAAEKMATQYGLTTKDVNNLAKSVDDLPASKQIKIEAETKAAADALALLKKQLAGIKSKSVVITAQGRFVNADRLPNGGRGTAGGQTFADGGPIRGYSPHAKADNILIAATADEYVIKQSSARKLGRSTLDYLNTYGQLPAGRALGGPVGQSVATSHSETTNAPVYIENVTGPTLADIEAEAERRRRVSALRRY